MSFTNNYNIMFAYQNINYNLKFVQSPKSGTSVEINNVTYYVLANKEKVETIKKILNTISLAIQDLLNKVEDLKGISSVKAHKIGIEILLTQNYKRLIKERMDTVKCDLISPILTPSQPIKKTNIEQRLQELKVLDVNAAVINFDDYPRLDQIEKKISELNKQIAYLEKNLKESRLTNSKNSKNLEKIEKRLQRLNDARYKAFTELPIKESEICLGNDVDCSTLPIKWNTYSELAVDGFWKIPLELIWH